MFPTMVPPAGRHIRLPALSLQVIALGATSIVTQIVILREFLSVFFGNELVIGIILANWMVLTGAGAFLGRYAGRMEGGGVFPAVSLSLLAVLPPATLFLLDALRNVVFPVGAMIGILQIMVSSFLLLVPYCVLSGFLFTYFARRASDLGGENFIPRVYALESVGSVLGGGAFTLVMVHVLTAFQSLTFFMLVNFVVGILSAWDARRRALAYAVAALGVFSVALVLFAHPDSLTKKLLFPDQDVLFHRDTPYGSLVVTQQGDQKNFFENSVLLFSTNDVTQNEEAVHYAMLQRPDPKCVLLIGGGISGTIDEILKYKVERIDYLELNPWVIELGRKFTHSLSSEKVNVINGDARRFLLDAHQRYDVVLNNLPDPTTAQINRCYTAEFFRELKKSLTRDAVVSLAVLSPADYLSKETREINSTMARTLKESFRNILFVPGMRNYVLASDGDLSVEIGRLVQERGISNLYVNQYYLDDRILRERSDYIAHNIDTTGPLNRDFTPVAYYQQLLYWLNYFRIHVSVVAVVGAVLLILLISRLNAVSFGMFAAGFAGSSIEILLLIAFQIIYGYVYQMTGVIITVFMAGLAVGAFIRRRVAQGGGMNVFLRVQLMIGIYALLLPLVFLFLQAYSVHSFTVQAIFVVLTFIIAVLVGMLFAVASRISAGKVSTVASGLYSIDLLGSAAGALLVTAYLIPLAGIVYTSMIVAALGVVSLVVSFVQRRNFSFHGGTGNG